MKYIIVLTAWAWVMPLMVLAQATEATKPALSPLRNVEPAEVTPSSDVAPSKPALSDRKDATPLIIPSSDHEVQKPSVSHRKDAEEINNFGGEDRLRHTRQPPKSSRTKPKD